jgi:hypothetical protein
MVRIGSARLDESGPIPSHPTEPSQRDSDRSAGRANWLMFGLRYVMPVAIVLGGAIVMALGGEDNLVGGAGIVGAGLAVYAVNWFYRVAVSGDRAREEEEAARVYLDVHGHWPDETAATRVSPARTAPAPSSTAAKTRVTTEARVPSHPPAQHFRRPHTSSGSGRRPRG